jgi:hypothetical protein
LATFNWIISNTSSTYASDATKASSLSVMPANLTISSTNNPFSISFSNQSMTYIPATSSNATSARYTFSFTQNKTVIPTISLTSSGATAVCFFNTTTFSGTLYLDAGRTFPSAAMANDTGLAGYTQWPYAIEITQSSPGGQDVPACYESVNGVVGARILTATAPEPTENECACDYRNY